MNYDDKRIKKLEQEKQQKLTNSNNVYDDLLIQQQDMLDRSNALTTKQLEQRQQETNQAYEREAMASESDYQNFINPYGVQAEKMASNGLSNAGYSESTKLGAYNTSRNRTAMAKANASKIVADYEMKKEEARLNNDSQKANIALEIMKQKLANEMNNFNTSLGLQQNKLGYQTDIDNTYYGRYKDVFDQQNWQKEYNLSKQKVDSLNSNGYELESSTANGSYQTFDSVSDLLDKVEVSKKSLGTGQASVLQKNIIAKELEKGNITKAEAIKLAEYYKL